MSDRRVFDETSLHEAIIRTWGEHGAHNDVFTAMRGEMQRLRAENERLRALVRGDLAPTTIEDGFGNEWRCCAEAKCDLQVVRPGKVQCNAVGPLCPNRAVES